MELHGGGKSCRAFIHIKDVVDATLKIALDAEPGTSWHISSNESISIYDLVTKIFSMTNSNFENLVVNVDERLGRIKATFLIVINYGKFTRGQMRSILN